MNENEPKLPDDIRKALQKSPTFSPPESFYRGVLEEIERKNAPALERHPWFWGYPAKGLAAACVLMVMVLMVREKKPLMAPSSSTESPSSASSHATALPSSSPAVVSGGAIDKAARVDSPLGAGGNDETKSLRDTKEVQRRMSRSISNLVGSPSPFAEEDAKLSGQQRVREDELETVEKVGAMKAAAAKSSLGYRQGQDAASSAGSGGRSRPANANEPQAEAPALAAHEYGSQATPWKGNVSGIAQFRTVVIQSQDSWNELWQEHSQGRGISPTPPEVDFDQSSIVGVFAGTNQSLQAITIGDIQISPERVTVLYVEEPVRPSIGLAAPANRPFDLQRIPKTSLPVTFKKQP